MCQAAQKVPNRMYLQNITLCAYGEIWETINEWLSYFTQYNLEGKNYLINFSSDFFFYAGRRQHTHGSEPQKEQNVKAATTTA